MKRVETAASYRRRRKRVSIHKRTAMCKVISKCAGRDQVSCQPVNGKAIGWAGELSSGVIGVLVNYDHSGFTGDIGQCVFINDHHTCIRIGANAQQTCCETGIDQAGNATALELMLIKYQTGSSKTQTAPVGVCPTRQPEIDAALLESVFRTIVACVAADHVERLNGCTRAIAAYNCTSIKCISHLRFEGCIGNHLHGNRLVTAEDVHAIQLRGEQIKITLQVCILADQHGSQYSMTGLVGKFHCVTGALHEAATVIRQSQILLAFTIRNAEGIGCKCNGDDKNFNSAICILLNCLACEKLQGIT